MTCSASEKLSKVEIILEKIISVKLEFRLYNLGLPKTDIEIRYRKIIN